MMFMTLYFCYFMNILTTTLQFCPSMFYNENELYQFLILLLDQPTRHGLSSLELLFRFCVKMQIAVTFHYPFNPRAE